jgi:hypothetical protein
MFYHSSCFVLCLHIHSQLLFYYLFLYFLPLPPYTVSCHSHQSACSPDRSCPVCLQRRWTTAEKTCRCQKYSTEVATSSCEWKSRCFGVSSLAASQLLGVVMCRLVLLLIIRNFSVHLSLPTFFPRLCPGPPNKFRYNIGQDAVTVLASRNLRCLIYFWNVCV